MIEIWLAKSTMGFDCSVVCLYGVKYLPSDLTEEEICAAKDEGLSVIYKNPKHYGKYGEKKCVFIGVELGKISTARPLEIYKKITNVDIEHVKEKFKNAELGGKSIKMYLITHASW